MGMVTGLSSRAPPNNRSLWETVLVGYDPSAQQVFASRDLCGHSMTDLPAMPENPFWRTFANLTLKPGEDLSLQLFVDGPLIELVANERAVLSVSVWPALNVSASLGAYGGAAIKALEYHALRSNLRPSDLPSSLPTAVMKADDSQSAVLFGGGDDSVGATRFKVHVDATGNRQKSHDGGPSPKLLPTKNLCVAVDPTACPAEQFAAAQLAKFLGQALRKEVPVLTPVAAETRCHISEQRCYIGVGAGAAVLDGVSVEFLRDSTVFGSDGILAATEGLSGKTLASMLLTGGLTGDNASSCQPRGTLNAVYEFLRFVGIRFFAINATRVPKLSSLPAFDRLYQPSFDFRMGTQFSITHDRWAWYRGPLLPTEYESSGAEFWVANHFNGVWGFQGCAGASNNLTKDYPCTVMPEPLPTEWGGSTIYASPGGQGADGDTSFLWAPVEDYNATHPEWCKTPAQFATLAASLTWKALLL